MVRDVKITVLETTFDRAIAEKYGAAGLSTCPVNKAGQVYISRRGLQPEGLCDDAWISMERFIFAMAHGVSEFSRIGSGFQIRPLIVAMMESGRLYLNAK